jgi:hypothetical protein
MYIYKLCLLTDYWLCNNVMSDTRILWLHLIKSFWVGCTPVCRNITWFLDYLHKSRNILLLVCKINTKICNSCNLKHHQNFATPESVNWTFVFPNSCSGVKDQKIDLRSKMLLHVISVYGVVQLYKLSTNETNKKGYDKGHLKIWACFSRRWAGLSFSFTCSPTRLCRFGGEVAIKRTFSWRHKVLPIRKGKYSFSIFDFA